MEIAAQDNLNEIIDVEKAPLAPGVERFFPIIVVSVIGIILSLFAGYLINNMLEVKSRVAFERAASSYLQGMRLRMSEALLFDPSVENIKNEKDLFEFVTKQASLIPVEGISSQLLKQDALQQQLDGAHEDNIWVYVDSFVIGNENWVFLAKPKEGYYEVQHWIVFVALLGFLGITSGISFYLFRLIKNREKNILVMLEKDVLNKRLERLFNEATEAKYLAEKANVAKSEFLSNMSHELRTPMHAILSYSGLAIALKPGDNTEKLNKYLHNIETSANRLMLLINRLLDLSKLESGKQEFDFQEADLREAIEYSVTELSSLLQNKNITVERLYAPDTLATFDKAKIIQVVINLLSNAVKFSPENSCIKISLEHARLNYSSPENSAILCSIEDRGIGVPKEELKEIFDKFIQSSKTKTGAGGTGLGLSISRYIIEAHHGSIWAENAPEGGSIFKFLVSCSKKTD